jgi:hypothetical protein
VNQKTMTACLDYVRERPLDHVVDVPHLHTKNIKFSNPIHLPRKRMPNSKQLQIYTISILLINNKYESQHIPNATHTICKETVYVNQSVLLVLSVLLPHLVYNMYIPRRDRFQPISTLWPNCNIVPKPKPLPHELHTSARNW